MQAVQFVTTNLYSVPPGFHDVITERVNYLEQGACAHTFMGGFMNA